MEGKIAPEEHFATPKLERCMLFAADYPFEDMEDAARWFDALDISEADKVAIGRTNAQRLLQLEQRAGARA